MSAVVSEKKLKIIGTNPDVNATFTGVPVKGDVLTNDDVPQGTTFGTPVADAGSYTLTPSVSHSGFLGGRKRKTRVAVSAVHSGSGVASKIWAFAADTANYAQ